MEKGDFKRKLFSDEPAFQHKRRIGPKSKFSLKNNFEHCNDEKKIFGENISGDFSHNNENFKALPFKNIYGSNKYSHGTEHSNMAIMKKRISNTGTKRTVGVQTKMDDSLKTKLKQFRVSLEKDKQELKRKLHNHNSNKRKSLDPRYGSHESFKDRIIKQYPEIKLELSSLSHRASHAPNATRKRIDHDDRSNYAIKKPVIDPSKVRMLKMTDERPKTAPSFLSNISEYQRSFGQPPSDYYPRHIIHSDTMFHQSRITSSNTKNEINFLESEYKRQYRPYTYMHEEPIKKAKILSNNELLARNQNKAKTKNMHKAGDCKSGIPVHSIDIPQKNKLRFLSEYHEKFGRFFSNVHDPSENSELRKWRAELSELRNQAKFYQERFRGSHFSRHHLAQLHSIYNNYWDEISTQRSGAYLRTDPFLMPPAGKPSSDKESLASLASLSESGYTSCGEQVKSSINSSVLDRISSGHHSAVEAPHYSSPLKDQNTLLMVDYDGGLINGIHPSLRRPCSSFSPKTKQEFYGHNASVSQANENSSNSGSIKILQHGDSSEVSSLASVTEHSILPQTSQNAEYYSNKSYNDRCYRLAIGAQDAFRPQSH